MKIWGSIIVVGVLFIAVNSACAQTSKIRNIIDDNYDYIVNLYEYIHAHPELSLQEKNTSERMAEEYRKLGYTVTENVGEYGIVAVMKNGKGPTVMARTELDALPIKEQTGIPYASDKMTENPAGQVVPVMHACGHDLHMSVMVGTATVLSHMKDQWHGAVMLIGQPAEEVGAGSKAMIEDGLFKRFPRPDYVLAQHVNSAMASGKVGYTSGYAYANVDEAKIVVKGRGGHGAYPDLTIDPVVLASKLVMDLQTIVSRDISPLDPAVVTVGSIHGGTSGNIIPNTVELELTFRSFNDKTRSKIIEKIKQACIGLGQTAGLPEKDFPDFVLKGDHVPSLYNDPALSKRIGKVFRIVLGDNNVSEIPPVMYGEDFGRYGRVTPEIPILMYSLGSQKPEDMKAAEEGDIDLPSTHSSKYLPDTKPTIKTGILTMSSALMNLLSSKE